MSCDPAFRQLETEGGLRGFVRDRIMGAPDLESLCAALDLVERFADHIGLPRDPVIGGSAFETFGIDEAALPAFAPLPPGVRRPIRMLARGSGEVTARSLDENRLLVRAKAGLGGCCASPLPRSSGPLRASGGRSGCGAAAVFSARDCCARGIVHDSGRNPPWVLA